MPADLTPERIAELRKPGKYISDSEVAALLDAAERVRELEAALEPFATHAGKCSDKSCPNCRAAALLNPEATDAR